ncbi:MAG: biliverdin-producing heme oxygenase [Pseudomonadota bacterium]
MDGAAPHSRDAHPVGHTRLRETLREATRELHQTTEMLWTKSDEFQTKDAYLNFLATVLKVHIGSGLPAAIARGDRTEIAEERTRIDALCKDLDCSHVELNPPRAMDQDRAWGVGYVLNGSAIGATVMLRGGYLGEDWPQAYLHVGQAYVQSGKLKRFFDALEDGPQDATAVTAGAMDTFKLFAVHAENRAALSVS